MADNPKEGYKTPSSEDKDSGFGGKGKGTGDFGGKGTGTGDFGKEPEQSIEKIKGIDLELPVEEKGEASIDFGVVVAECRVRLGREQVDTSGAFGGQGHTSGDFGGHGGRCTINASFTITVDVEGGGEAAESAEIDKDKNKPA